MTVAQLGHQGKRSQTQPTWDGIPFQANPGGGYPQLREGDRRQPELVRGAKARVFDLNKPPDLQAYQEVWDKIVKGQAGLGAELPQFCEMTQNWKIFMRWVEYVYMMPDPGASTDQHTFRGG